MGAWEDFLSKNAIASGSGLATAIQSDPELAKNYGWTGGTGGSSSSGAFGGPAGLAAAFRQPDVTLPDTQGAMTGLRDLEMTGAGGLKALLAPGNYDAQTKATRDAIYANAASDINYSGDRLAQGAKEGQNAKNFLNSSATGDYFLDPIERNRATALERAANDAYVTSQGMTNANMTTQAGLMGAAINSGNAGLQSEANVLASNRTANQNATTAGYQTGLQVDENAANRAQQLGEFGRSLDQQKDLTQQGFQTAKDINSSNAIGAGIGGLANLFAPQLQAGATALTRSLFS